MLRLTNQNRLRICLGVVLLTSANHLSGAPHDEQGEAVLLEAFQAASHNLHSGIGTIT